MKQSFPGISGSTLKRLAILTMLIDHTGATVIRTICRLPAVTSASARYEFWSSMYTQSRSIGRIAFPIFCFLIVEGFLHTRNVARYAFRLFLFALLSEIPFDLSLKGNWYYPKKQNVYFTLLIGLLVLICIRWITEHIRMQTHRKLTVFVQYALYAAVLAAGMYLALRIDTDYNYKGVFLIGILYLTHANRLFQCLGGAIALAWEMPASAAFLPVWLYNGKRGRSIKYFFYFFYPAHLLILHAVSVYLIPAVFG